MSIINVNAFQNGINKSSYLTSYTDAYLKQSLANLGQRIGAKGDSISFDNFTVQELFPNFTGNFNEDRLLVQFKYNPNEENVVGQLMLLEDDGNVKTLAQEEASSKVTISNIDGLLNGIGNEIDDENIKISDVQSINNVSYWHKESAVIYKTANSLVYKVVGHHEGGAYGDYDNEYVCEEVGDDGKFIEGFRIFIANEMNLLANPVDEPKETKLPKDDDNKREILVLIHLRRKNDKERTDKNFDNVDWALDVYKFSKTNRYWLDLGDVASDLGDSNNVDLLVKNYDQTNTARPGEFVSSLLNGILDEDRAGIISYLYTLPIQYDTSKNVAWSVPDSFLPSWKSLGNNKSFSGVGTGVMRPDVNETVTELGISADMDILDGQSLSSTNGKIEYFNNDVNSLYPRLLDVYNEVMYKSSSNLKIKEQIVGQLVYKAWQQAMSLDGITDTEKENVYVVYMPINYTFKYTYNSSDKSVIYNMSSSVPVMFDNIANIIGTTITPATDSVKLLEKIAWDASNTDENYSPEQTIFANSAIQNTVMYDLIITYNDDLILLNMKWFASFIMPYIDSTGFWVINGVKTSNYAKGIVGEQGNLIITMSDNLSTFNPSKGILSGAGIDELKSLSSKSFELKEFKTDYVSNSESTSMRDPYTMYAYLPSDETVTQLVNTDTFSYLSGAVIMSMSAMSLEKNAFEVTYAEWSKGTGKYGYVIGNYDEIKEAYYSDKYDKKDYTDWGLYENSAYSYIYRMSVKSNSLNNELGSNGVVMSFWTCNKHESQNKTYYGFDYIKRPGSNIALDFSYMTNLEQYVKHYAKVVFSPDDYEHTQLIFDPINLTLKNNTIDVNQKIWPTILNRNADYYAPIGDTSKDLGQNNDVSSQQYMNSANLVVEFNDTITRNNGSVDKVTNSKNERRFKIDTYTYTYYQPYTYVDAIKNENGEYEVTEVVGKKPIEISYGVIPAVINYTYYPKEYIPNSKYDPNDNTTAYQYPSLDIKEVLVRNINAENRVNVIGFQPMKEGDLISYGVMYNAYIGTSFEDEDKSILHIGTSSTNPNLGTTTMVDDESSHKLTPMGTLSVDFDQINLNGYTSVKGEIITDRPIWSARNTECNFTTYVATFYPNGKVYDFDDDTQVDNLLGTKEFETKQRLHTRYFDGPDNNSSNKTLTVSYLNVTKLLEDAHIPNDNRTIVRGDTRLLSTFTSTQNNEQIEIAKKLAQLEKEHPGWFQVKMIEASNGIFRKNENWSAYYPTNTEEWKEASKLLKLEDNVLTYTSDEQGTDLSITYTYMKDGQGNLIVNDQGMYEVEKEEPTRSKQYVTWFEGVLEEAKTSYYLELSTDLTNNENRLGYGKDRNNTYVDIMQSNPIQVSYVDIPDSYTATYNVPTYTYVPMYLYYNPDSYTEVWYCDGCDLCSENTCDHITKCNKSSCKGYWTPSYTADYQKALKSARKPYEHHRWYKDGQGNYIEYIAYSYYPMMYYKKSDFGTIEEFDTFRKDKDNRILTYYPSPNVPGLYEYRWMIESSENNTYLADKVPYTLPIQSAYIMDYATSYLADKKWNICDERRLYTYEGEWHSSKQTTENAIKNTFTKVYLSETQKDDNNIHYNAENEEVDFISEFSYYTWKMSEEKYPLTLRSVNVREIMTSHSRPEFFNELLDEEVLNTINNNPDSVQNPSMPNINPKPTEDKELTEEPKASWISGKYVHVDKDEVVLYDIDKRISDKALAKFDNIVENSKVKVTAYNWFAKKIYNNINNIWIYDKQQTMENAADSIMNNDDENRIAYKLPINGNEELIRRENWTNDASYFNWSITNNPDLMTYYISIDPNKNPDTNKESGISLHYDNGDTKKECTEIWRKAEGSMIINNNVANGFNIRVTSNYVPKETTTYYLDVLNKNHKSLIKDGKVADQAVPVTLLLHSYFLTVSNNEFSEYDSNNKYTYSIDAFNVVSYGDVPVEVTFDGKKESKYFNSYINITYNTTYHYNKVKKFTYNDNEYRVYLDSNYENNTSRLEEEWEFKQLQNVKDPNKISIKFFKDAK